MYLSIHGIPTDQDLARYPAVHLTGPHEWDPSVLDYTHPSGDGEPPWSNDPDERYAFDPNFDEFGDYTQRAIQTRSILDDSSSTLTPCSTYIAHQHDFKTYQHAVKHEAPDYEKFRPYFGWVNVDTFQKTMEQSTQWGVSLPNTFPMKRHLKSRNPALNVPRRHEAVATGTVFSGTPAVDSGVKQAQVSVGRDTLVADAYPMKSGKQFVNTLEDNIRRRGAMDKLLSDSAKTEISNKAMDIIRAYHISNWHSEPYHQNQNPAEWRYRTIKSWTNTVMNRSGARANCWLLCLIYACYLLNHIACTALDGKIPLLAFTGITPDISIILLFTFYQPVFYATYDQHFPSESEERAGYWVGFGEHCGDAMTHKILDQDTQKIIYRSAVRPKKSSTPNHRLAPHGGEVSTSSDPSEDKISSGSTLGSPEGSSPKQKAPTVFIRSRDEENPSRSKPMPTFDTGDLIVRTFLLPPEENGERHRAKITRKVVEIIDQEDGKRVENVNFILDIGNGKVEELISYNQLLEHLENAQHHDMGMDQELYKFRAIIGHQGPLLASDPDWKGSKYNVQVEWETGEITFEPLSIIAADDPVTCAAYAKENDLLALEGWCRFRSLAKKKKVLARSIKQSMIRQVRRSQTSMFGYLIPRNYMEAMQFDSENKKRAGYWVGFGEHCGDAMTHKILDQDTQKIIYRSAVRPKKSSTPNHRLAPHGGEVSTSSDPSEDKISSGSTLGSPEGSSPKQKAPTVFIRSRDEENPSRSKPMPTFDTGDLIVRTFLLPPEENGERHRAKITRKVVEIIDQEDGKRVVNVNFILDIGNGKVEELISYNQLLEHLENAQHHDMGMDQELYKFRAIIGHQGPLLASDPDWKGSKYNVQVEWETGEISFEPLSIIAADDPVTCAAYAKENDLLALEGWCRFRSLAKKNKVLARSIKQSKIRQVRRSQTSMFGYLIPRNYMEAMQFDSENKNSKWYDAIELEMESMAENKVFKKWDKAILDKHKKVKNPPKGYHRIKVHLVFAVKFDGRHKAGLVADGHLTPEPIENIYSGVVSLKNLRLVIFLGKLINLELWGADIGNAYPEAFTDEKLYIVVGPEFQELEGYILIFLKALYGLKSSGRRWAEVIHGILRDMKFLPSRADPCIWLRKAPNLRCYEYIAVYVDDLCIAAESPSAIIQIFKSKYHLEVKGDGKLAYHLGADYFEDPDGTFVSQPKEYIDKLADTYKRLFNEDPPKGYKTSLDKNDHPELVTSEILEGDMAAKYLTMVGQLQWLVTLGRFDIHAQVATISRFRAAPRQGHMDRLKRIYSYAIRTKDYAIRFRTEKPDDSFLPDQDFGWTYSVYGDVHEILPDDMPEPLGESVTTTTTMDANLNHCLVTGKSLTGCLHFVNKTPVD